MYYWIGEKGTGKMFIAAGDSKAKTRRLRQKKEDFCILK